MSEKVYTAREMAGNLEEKGTIKVKVDMSEIVLTYRLSEKTLNRCLDIFDRIVNKKSVKKLWKHFISESRRIRRKKNI